MLVDARIEMTGSGKWSGRRMERLETRTEMRSVVVVSLSMLVQVSEWHVM